LDPLRERFGSTQWRWRCPKWFVVFCVYAVAFVMIQLALDGVAP
jgi:hypothetical protein